MIVGVFSDPHLGKYGESLARNGSGLNTRLVDFAETLDSITTQMINRGVQLVLFPGDAFKHKLTSPTEQRMFQNAMHKLLKANINILSIQGNHDIGRVGGAESGALDPITTFPFDHDVTWTHVTKPELHQIVIGGEMLQIACLPYPNRQQLLAHPHYHELAPSGLNEALSGVYTQCMLDLVKLADPHQNLVLMAHCSPDIAVASTDQTFMMQRDMCLPVAAIPVQVDWVFFGHVHKPQQMVRPEKPGADNASNLVWVVGSTDQKDFGEEGETKRWLCLNTKEDSMVSYGTGCRLHRTIDIDLTELQDVVLHPETLVCNIGEIVRVRVKLRRGQEAPEMAWRQTLLNDYKAQSVMVRREYVSDDRMQTADLMGEQMSHAEIFRHYVMSRKPNMPDDKLERITNMAVGFLPAEVQAQ